MPILRTSVALSSFTRCTPLTVRQTLAARPISSTPARFAQGYRDGEGDRKGENPQDQGSSGETEHDAEHPGPAPPREGHGTGAGPTKRESDNSPEESSAQSGGARSKEVKEPGSSPTGGSLDQSGAKGKHGASPRIQNKSDPGRENDGSKQAEVEKHNREFEQRHDRAPKAAGDKVDKKFWSGQGGADSQP